MYNSPRVETAHAFSPQEQLRFVVEPFMETALARELRTKLFARRLLEMQQTLQDPRVELRTLEHPLEGQASAVLYRQDKKIAFDGRSYALLRVEQAGDDVTLHVTEIFYSHVIASRYPEYAALRQQEGLPEVSAGFGLCCALVTSDGKVLLTERSAAAAAHPSLLHTMGGNIDVQTSPQETILSEVEEEIGLQPTKHFSPEDLVLVALMYDKHFEDGPVRRPDLVFYLPLHATWEEVMAIFAAKHEREVDSVDIQPFALDDTFPARFENLLRDHRIIPSGEACLAYAWHHARAETA